MVLNQLYNAAKKLKSRARPMPLLFIGHGHPINVLLDNEFTQTLRRIGKEIERPNAILIISAHWETIGTFVSTNPNPRTIHDFGRFDDRLYDLDYIAPGSPKLADSIVKHVSSHQIGKDENMGFDHGAWTILEFLSPQGDIPVLEMSLDYGKDPRYHYELAAQLAYLREKGVLIVSSGNIVHNLNGVNWDDIYATPLDWNLEFDNKVKTLLDHQEIKSLIDYHKFGELGKLAIPTNEHYLPMIYSLGMLKKNESIEHIYEGYQFGSMSMRCFKIE